jgi:hypothetical protein
MRSSAISGLHPLLVHDRGPVSAASDDWPFLYLRDRSIPDFTVRSMLILGFFGIGMVYLFLPKGPIALDSRMFFLGAGFMLLEPRRWCSWLCDLAARGR